MKIETKRLIIGEWNKKDIKDLIENVNNLKVTKWLLVVPYPYKLKDAKWWINHCEKNKKKKPRTTYDLAIELKSEKKVIGGVGLNKIDTFQGSASGGYWLGEKYWRRGYGSEVLDALLKFAFNKLKLRRLEAGVFGGNIPSAKLLEKFGFKQEGIKRKSVRSKADKKLYDEWIYGILKEDWRKK